MSDDGGSSRGGVSFCGLLTLLFVGLKLAHVINWSWWWVLAPIWMPILGVLVIVLIMLVVAGIVHVFDR